MGLFVGLTFDFIFSYGPFCRLFIFSYGSLCRPFKFLKFVGLKQPLWWLYIRAGNDRTREPMIDLKDATPCIAKLCHDVSI
jgi:hypothetical protein